MIQAKITSHFVSLGTPHLAFYAIIPCLLLAAIGASALPTLSTEANQQNEALETA
ncbi:MAG: hypothetical protein ACIAZJ_06195 [Gimesia chilikensis]|uniref:hypothetical protein n=1 Tax=Gimesia chilikensis TaxID=2605989 RepID=UPI0037A71CF5